MQRPTETRWLSHQSAVNALRRCLKSAMLTLEQDAAEGITIALGLSLQMSKPKFVATLLLMNLETTLEYIDISHPLKPEDFVGEPQTYINAL